MKVWKSLTKIFNMELSHIHYSYLGMVSRGQGHAGMWCWIGVCRGGDLDSGSPKFGVNQTSSTRARELSDAVQQGNELGITSLHCVKV